MGRWGGSIQIDCLGTTYTLLKRSLQTDKTLEDCDGYCDFWRKKIVCCDLSTSPEWKDSTEEGRSAREASAVRHELIHAFLYESEMAQDSHVPYKAWAQDEEMVDWFAIQGPKIYKAWQEAGVV